MTTFVYLIQSLDSIKIGISNSPESRLASLQTGSPEPLKIAYLIDCKSRDDAMSLERILHKQYSDYRINGEWFSVDVQGVIEGIERSLSIAHCIEGIEHHREEIVTTVIQEKVKSLGILKPLFRLIKTIVENRNNLNPSSYKKRTMIVNDKVKDYLLANPNNASLSARELSKIIGAGKSTISRVRRELRDSGKL